MAIQDWYSVRSIFRFDLVERGMKQRTFEERVVIVRAKDFKEAIAKGEAEGKSYSKRFKGKRLKYLMAFNIQATQLKEGDEIWSSIRDVNIGDKEFVERFYQDEKRCQEIKSRKKRMR